MSLSEVWVLLSLLSLAIWIGLVGFRGQFWRADQRLNSSQKISLAVWPSVCAVVPARNEATVLPTTLRSLLTQNYPGQFSVIVVNDHSTDGTEQVAQEIAQALQRESQLQVLSTDPLPPGWSGKLWAVNQGIQHTLQSRIQPPPDYFLLTDADIEHASNNLHNLVTKAQQESLDLVSQMVLLRCESIWEQLLIPAFVFFFQKLYPFRWVNDPTRPTAAAAGGCILVNQEALRRAGGIAAIRDALIDDCALAAAIQSSGNNESAKGKLWLGLTTTTHSLRTYTSLESIWTMVARTAFTQLHYSPWLLIGTLFGMGLVYIVPPLSMAIGIATGIWPVALTGSLAWVLMTLSFWPTVHLYRISPLWTLSLPVVAVLYTLMTLDSALRHWQGKGGAWKGRVYPLRSS